MNAITKYLAKFFASKRIIGNDKKLNGLLKADILLQKLIDENKVPGIAITVLKNGNTLFQKGYGYANLKDKIAVDPENTIFRIASISKNIAATVLAHMVNDGLIDLDASFYKYVPYFPKKEWDFSIRQLASHTAGIRGYQGVEFGLNKPYTIKESIEIFAADDLIFEPGTDYNYNTFDWVLLSLAMQEVSQIPFEKYVQEKVLNPLGMTKTFAPDLIKSADKVENCSCFYSKNKSGFRKAISVNNYYKLAGGGYLSTSKDIANFGQTYLNNEVLDEEIIIPFLTSEIINGKKTNYGLGWQVSKDVKGRPYYGHVGNGVGVYSNFYVYPQTKMVFSILINCTNPGIQQELDKVIDELCCSKLS